MIHIVTVIPTFNRRAHLRDILHDLMSQRLQNFSMDVVVVVDGSTDGTIEMLDEEFPTIHQVQGEGDWWYTRSMNEGFKKASTLDPDMILTLNDDTRLDERYVANILSSYLRHDRNTIMGSLSVTYDEPRRVTFSGVKDIDWWRFKYHSHLPYYDEIDIKQLCGEKESVVVPGRGTLIPWHLIEELDGFDDNLVQYGSDDDFCLRARKTGADVMISYMAVVYSHDQLTGTGNPVRKEGFWTVLKAFKNRYSMLYIPKYAAILRRHGNKILWPFTLLIVIAGSLKANMKFKLQ